MNGKHNGFSGMKILIDSLLSILQQHSQHYIGPNYIEYEINFQLQNLGMNGVLNFCGKACSRASKRVTVEERTPFLVLRRSCSKETVYQLHVCLKECIATPFWALAIRPHLPKRGSCEWKGTRINNNLRRCKNGSLIHKSCQCKL